MKKLILIYLVALFFSQISSPGLLAVTSPTLQLPVNNELGYMRHPNFQWSDVQDATAYEIQISSNSSFTNIVDTDVIETNRYVPLLPLGQANRYWRVRSLNQQSNPTVASNWSSTFTYRLRSPGNTYTVNPSDSLSMIRATIKTATENTPAIVNFTAGTYNLTPAGGGDFLFVLDGVDDLIVYGNFANINITDPTKSLFLIRDCNRITIKLLNIDYTSIPHTVGTVTEKNPSGFPAGSFTVTPETGYADFDAPHILASSEWGSLLDKNNKGWLKPGVLNSYNCDSANVTNRGNGSFTLELDNPVRIEDFEVGDKFAYFARAGTSTLFKIVRGTDVTLDRVTIYSCPSTHFNAFDTSELKVLGCNSLRKDSNRWLAGNADFVHTRANQVGPWIEGCEIQGIGDDGVAIYNRGCIILDQIDDTHIEVKNDYSNNFQVHDKFTFFDPRTGGPIGNLVHTVENTSNGIIEFKPALTDNLAFNESSNDAQDQIFNLTRSNQKSVIRDNKFDGVRRYGNIVRAVGALICDNEFRGVSNGPIVLRNEASSSYNGLYSQNVKILRNTISDSSFVKIGANAHVDVAIYKLTGYSQEKDIHYDISIEENTFVDWINSAISLRNVQLARVIGNTFTREDPIDKLPTVSLISLQHSSDITIFDNVVRDGDVDVIPSFIVQNNCSNVTHEGTVFTDYQIRNKYTGKALRPEGSSVDNNANIVQWTLNTSWQSQQWYVRDAGNGNFQIINRYSGRALRPENSGTAVNQPIVQYDLDTSWQSQRWSILPNSEAGYFNITNQYTNKSLATLNGTTVDGLDIVQKTPSTSFNTQKWELLPTD